MNRILSLIDEFLHNSTWKDLLSLKICFISAGAFFGTLVPRKKRKAFAAVAAIITIAAAIPAALKLFRLICGNEKDVCEV